MENREMKLVMKLVRSVAGVAALAGLAVCGDLMSAPAWTSSLLVVDVPSPNVGASPEPVMSAGYDQSWTENELVDAYELIWT
jgi:hypothetical protein